MATKFVSYRQESKINYGQDKTVLSDGSTEGTTLEQLNAGSLQRIADATELMASNYLQLQREVKQWKERAESHMAWAEKAERRIAALKGVITKMKKVGK